MPEAIAELPSATPATATPHPEGAQFKESFSTLEGLFPQVEEAPTPAKADSAPAKPTPETPQTLEKPTTAPKPEAKEPSKPAEKAPERPTTPPQPEKAKTLREAKDMAEAKAKDWERRYKELETKSAQPKEDPRLKDYETRYESAQKRLTELEQELKYSAYEKSQEYKDKYEQPYFKAYEEGREFVSQLEVVERTITDKETGEVKVVQPARAATAKDFDELMGLYRTSAAEGARKANQLFGDMSADVKIKLGEVKKILKEAQEARDTYRTKGSEIEKQRAEQHTNMAKEAAQVWEAENNAAIEKYPQWFKAEDGDEKGNSLLAFGMDLANKVFDGRAEQLNHKERARLHAAIRNKAGGFDRLAHKYAQAMKQLKEAQDKLAQYEDSEPSGGSRRGEGTAEKRDDMDGVLAGLDAIATPMR